MFYHQGKFLWAATTHIEHQQTRIHTVIINVKKYKYIYTL